VTVNSIQAAACSPDNPRPFAEFWEPHRNPHGHSEPEGDDDAWGRHWATPVGSDDAYAEGKPGGRAARAMQHATGHAGNASSDSGAASPRLATRWSVLDGAWESYREVQEVEARRSGPGHDRFGRLSLHEEIEEANSVIERIRTRLYQSVTEDSAQSDSSGSV
jgi:hypothetical protein